MGKYQHRTLWGVLVRNMVLSVSQSLAQLRSPRKEGSCHPISSAPLGLGESSAASGWGPGRGISLYCLLSC